jgi:uncharacterized protein DUF4019
VVRPLQERSQASPPRVTPIRIFIAACAIALWIALVPTATAAPNPNEAAESAALDWLHSVDAGNYAQSWRSASSLFRQKVSESQWQSAAASARAPLGTLKSRKLLSATPKNALPGAPDRQYVVIQFASSFEYKAGAIETVTPVMDIDGKWRVSGYYINDCFSNR